MGNIPCALVTGASKGIGKAIAIQLAQDHGVHLLINYARDEAGARATLAAIEAAGGSGELMPFLVQEKAQVDQSLQAWLEAHPNHKIRVLVNNAGISRDRLLMWMEEPDWDEIMAVSAKGMFNVTRAVIRAMLKQRWGRIINISSLSGAKGLAGQVNYSAAKAAMIGATKALAQEVGKRNITVNAVAPGFIQTNMTTEMDESQLLPLIPLGRFGKAEEVAHLVSFLASDRAAYLTGEVIHLNGGMYS